MHQRDFFKSSSGTRLKLGIVSSERGIWGKRWLHGEKVNEQIVQVDMNVCIRNVKIGYATIFVVFCFTPLAVDSVPIDYTVVANFGGAMGVSLKSIEKTSFPLTMLIMKVKILSLYF